MIVWHVGVLALASRDQYGVVEIKWVCGSNKSANPNDPQGLLAIWLLAEQCSHRGRACDFTPNGRDNEFAPLHDHVDSA